MSPLANSDTKPMKACMLAILLVSACQDADDDRRSYHASPLDAMHGAFLALRIDRRDDRTLMQASRWDGKTRAYLWASRIGSAEVVRGLVARRDEVTSSRSFPPGEAPLLLEAVEALLRPDEAVYLAEKRREAGVQKKIIGGLIDSGGERERRLWERVEFREGDYLPFRADVLVEIGTSEEEGRIVTLFFYGREARSHPMYGFVNALEGDIGQFWKTVGKLQFGGITSVLPAEHRDAVDALTRLPMLWWPASFELFMKTMGSDKP